MERKKDLKVATHMLSPMPLAISLGVGSQSVPHVMPAVENINGY